MSNFTVLRRGAATAACFFALVTSQSRTPIDVPAAGAAASPEYQNVMMARHMLSQRGEQVVVELLDKLISSGDLYYNPGLADNGETDEEDWVSFGPSVVDGGPLAGVQVFVLPRDDRSVVALAGTIFHELIHYEHDEDWAAANKVAVGRFGRIAQWWEIEPWTRSLHLLVGWLTDDIRMFSTHTNRSPSTLRTEFRKLSGLYEHVAAYLGSYLAQGRFGDPNTAIWNDLNAKLTSLGRSLTADDKILIAAATKEREQSNPTLTSLWRQALTDHAAFAEVVEDYRQLRVEAQALDVRGERTKVRKDELMAALEANNKELSEATTTGQRNTILEKRPDPRVIRDLLDRLDTVNATAREMQQRLRILNTRSTGAAQRANNAEARYVNARLSWYQDKIDSGTIWAIDLPPDLGVNQSGQVRPGAPRAARAASRPDYGQHAKALESVREAIGERIRQAPWQ